MVRVTNRGNVAFPTKVFGREWKAAFGQEINKPGQPHYPGKAVYTFTKARGGHCDHGTYGPTSKIQTFGCDVRHLAPGESQAAVVKIKHIKGPLLLDAGLTIVDGTISVNDDRSTRTTRPRRSSAYGDDEVIGGVRVSE